MSALLLALGLALAGETGELTTWSTSAVEVLPFLDGGVGVRGSQRLGLEAENDSGVRFGLDLSMNQPPLALGTASVDLNRLALDVDTGRGRVRAGRLLLLDSRGWTPIDGAILEMDSSPFFGPRACVGRLWSPEHDGESSGATVAGLDLKLRPPTADGEASRAVAFDVGWMARLARGDTSNSLFAGAALRRPRGDNLALDAEIRLGGLNPGSRAGLRGTAFLGQHLSLSPELRWEDLSPDSQLVGLRTPMDWLGGQGYLASGLAARLDLGPVSVQASGGPSLHRDETGLGGLGRAGLGWRAEGAGLGVFGAGAALGGSHLAGGGVEGSFSMDGLSLRAEAASFRLAALDGGEATVGEARARLSAPLGAPREDARLALTLDLSGGSDRQLQRWARGALALEGRLGSEGVR